MPVMEPVGFPQSDSTFANALVSTVGRVLICTVTFVALLLQPDVVAVSQNVVVFVIVGVYGLFVLTWVVSSESEYQV